MRRTGSRSSRSLGLLVCVCLEAVLLLLLVAPQLVASGDPLATDPAAAFTAPGVEHVFGTDQAGRDVFTRIVYGARTTLVTGLVATAAAVSGGLLCGVAAALSPAWVRALTLRCTEALLALPEFLVALLIVAYTGKGAAGVTAAVALATLPGYLRVAFTATRATVHTPAFESAKVMGVSGLRLVAVYVLPSVVKTVAALAVLGVGVAILMITGLTFLGLGLTPPAPDWGAMLNDAPNYFRRGWYLAVFPGAALVGTVMLLTMHGRMLQNRWQNV